MSRRKRLDNAMGCIEEVLPDIEELKNEIEEWYSNMEGTNLESTQKYELLVECAEGLEEAYNQIQSGIDDLLNIEFPTMFS